ncbi:MAG: glutathione S-transferase family protein, partial [Alphaproteobacteria bacterium]|nr:glutathione S-transferase family protein [Alphaproteobacteria bacterium]
TAAKAHRTPEYMRDVHPLGTVPALRLPDGRVLIESAGIALYLAEVAPDLAPAAGTPERALFLQWLSFGAGTLYPACLRIYHAEHFAPEGTDLAGVSALGKAAFDRAWAVVEVALGDAGPYLFGDAHSAADVYLAMLASWHPDKERFTEACPRVERMRAAVWDMPSMRAALAFHGIG